VRDIVTDTRDFFFSAGVKAVSGAEADSNRDKRLRFSTNTRYLEPIKYFDLWPIISNVQPGNFETN